MFGVHRRLCRIRGCRCMACRVVHRSKTTRKGSWFHTSVFVARWNHGRRSKRALCIRRRKNNGCLRSMACTKLGGIPSSRVLFLRYPLSSFALSCPSLQLGLRNAQPALYVAPALWNCSALSWLKTTIITTLMFAGSYGIAFGAIQQLPQILSAPRVATQK